VASTADFSTFIDVTVKSITPLVEQANETATRIQNADNVSALVHEVRDKVETSDETILSYREWLDAANNEILNRQKEVEQYIIDNNLVDTEPVDVDAETAKYKTLAEQVKAFRKVLDTIPGGKEALEDLPNMISISGRSGGGSTGPRPRIQAIKVDGEDVFRDVKQKDGSYKRESNFTTLSLFLKKTFKGSDVQVKDLQENAFAAAGTQDFNTLNGSPFEFSYTVNFGTEDKPESKNIMVQVTPAVPKN